jgi:3'-phosphoadenosine 5'-phosphosulfate sulfotransferase (PAPS reductase)/FAD synthetase
MVQLSELKPYERNSRTHTDAQINQVIASIREFGWTNPILIDEAKMILAGHARTEGAKRMGMTEVPCLPLVGLTEAQKRAYIIADNKLAENAGWNEEMLASELAALKELDFNLELTGFEFDEIQELLAPPPEPNAGSSAPILKTATLAELAPTEEELKAFVGRKILVEFSGGKDSSATAVWAKHFFPDSEIELCFVDMGADHPGFNFFIHDFGKAIGCKLKILRSKENIIEAFLRRSEWPGHFHPYCHNFLHQALDDNIKAYDPSKVICIRGGRLKEKASAGKVNTSRFLVIDRLSQYTYFQPLYFTEKNVGEELIKEAGMPIWEGYSYGLQRTACRICPGQRPIAYAAMRANFPQTWAELTEFEKRFGPGCWQDKDGEGHGSLIDNANRGQENFEAGNYRKRVGNT